MSGGYALGTPGFTASRTTVEKDLSWGGDYGRMLLKSNVVLASTATDATNSPTNVLRPGLILGKVTSTGKYIERIATATDGSQYAVAINEIEVNNLDPVTAAAVERFIPVLVGGPVKAGSLVGLDLTSRSQLRDSGFIFDDDRFAGLPWTKEITTSGDLTLTAATHHNALILVTGAATITLPAITAGFRCRILNTADNTVTIASAGSNDDLITDGDATADSVAWSTSSHKIGGCVEIIGNAAGTKWYVFNLGNPGVVVSVA